MCPASVLVCPSVSPSALYPECPSTLCGVCLSPVGRDTNKDTQRGRRPKCESAPSVLVSFLLRGLAGKDTRQRTRRVPVHAFGNQEKDTQ